MSGLVLDGIGKQFGSVVAVKNVNLDLPKGKFISFLGPSGCGKTTLLRTFATLLTPSMGQLELFGLPVSGKSFLVLESTQKWPICLFLQLIPFFLNKIGKY